MYSAYELPLKGCMLPSIITFIHFEAYSLPTYPATTASFCGFMIQQHYSEGLLWPPDTLKAYHIG